MMSDSIRSAGNTVNENVLVSADKLTTLKLRYTRPDTGNITKTTVAQDGGGIYGYLKVKFASGSPTHPTTWQYRLHNTSGWSPAQPLAMGTTVTLTGNMYYDVNFYPSGSNTVVPDPYNNVLVTADKKNRPALDYSP
jgi:hypothetical protein